MDAFNMEINGTLTEHQIDVLSTVYLSLLTPSVIGSASVLIVSIIKRRHLRKQVHLLVQLSLADLLAALILMSTSTMNKISPDDSIIICSYGLPLSLTFYLISFLLVVIYAWKSKEAIQGWRAQPAVDEGSQCQRKMEALSWYTLVWLIPIAAYLTYVLTPFIKYSPVIPSTGATENVAADEDRKYCTSCILFLHIWRDSCSDAEKIHDTFIRVFLFVVVIPAMLFCSVIYYKVGKWYKQFAQEGLFPVEGDGRSRKRFKRAASTARNMVMVILFCWTPALVLILMSTLMIWTDIQQQSLFFLYIIQAATVSLQGFLNSMVYAWKRRNFTEAVLGEHTPLVGYSQAFFDESLRSPA